VAGEKFEQALHERRLLDAFDSRTFGHLADTADQ
jgi:hypothetical protein